MGEYLWSKSSCSPILIVNLSLLTLLLAKNTSEWNQPRSTHASYEIILRVYDPEAVGIVGSGNMIGNLLGSELKTFRFGRSVLRDRLSFVRKESSADRPHQRSMRVRYAHTFPQGYGIWDSQG